MFTVWFKANKIFEEVRLLLTYGQFVSKFVHVKQSMSWKPQKRGYIIGRLMWVPHNTWELFYLWIMLIVKKGLTCYNDIKNVDNFQHETFRDAYFAMRFLQDDREFINEIKGAHH